MPSIFTTSVHMQFATAFCYPIWDGHLLEENPHQKDQKVATGCFIVVAG